MSTETLDPAWVLDRMKNLEHQRQRDGKRAATTDRFLDSTCQIIELLDDRMRTLEGACRVALEHLDDRWAPDHDRGIIVAVLRDALAKGED